MALGVLDVDAAAGRRKISPSMGSVVVLSAFGVPFGIRVSDPALLRRVRKHIPPQSEPSSATPTRTYSLRSRRSVTRTSNVQHRNKTRKRQICYEVWAGKSCVVRTHSLSATLNAFESDLQLYVAEMSEDKVFLHAGVVEWKGAAIVIPAPSGSGKTTLVASMLQRGATYYSDEYAVLDKEGRVHPYARSLSVKTPKGQRRKHPQLFGSGCGIEPIPVGLVVLTRFRKGGQWRPHSVTAGRAVLALAKNAVAIRRQPERVLSFLCRALLGVPTLETERGEASNIAQLILREAGKLRFGRTAGGISVSRS